jgi:polyether ionophore transport system permease protein
MSVMASSIRFTRIQWRFRRRQVVIWVFVLAVALASTALGVAGLYKTPAQIHDYADSVSGGALYALNGRFEGIDTLGGVIQDEFGFIGSFLLPFAGLALMAKATRGEEEEGRLELLLARPLDRRAPTVGAFAVTTGTIVAATILMGAGIMLFAPDVPTWRGFLYAISLGALAYCFAGIAAVAAQLVRHTRGVYAVGFVLLLVSYLLRGIGDTTDIWITWLSPLGWTEKVGAFGPARWWVLAIPIAVGTVGVVVATVLAGRRDLGDSTLQFGVGGPPTAGPRMRRPVGTAIRVQRPAMIGWTLGAVAFMGMLGGLAQQAVSAIADNKSLADALNTSTGNLADGFYAMGLVYLALIVIGYIAAAFAAVRREESSNRIEPVVGASVARSQWLAANTLAAAVGALVVGLAGTLTFALSAAASNGDAGLIGELVRAGLAYLPAYLAVVGIACALFGLQPRAYPLMWGVLGAIAFIAFLGPGLNMPTWVADLSPTQHVGDPPGGSVEALGLIMLTLIGAALVGASFVGFRERDIPHP